MKVTYIERKGFPGSWKIRIETVAPSGGRAFAYQTVNGTRDDAEMRKREILRTHEEGTYTEPSKILVGAYLDQWLAQRFALGKITPNTRKAYAGAIEWMRPHVGGVRLQAFRGAQITALYAALVSVDGLSMATVYLIHRVLSVALKAARRANLIAANPLEQAEAPSKPKPDPKALNADETEALLQALPGRWFEPHVLVALGTGLRRGELCGLRWRDVDGSTLHVRGQMVENEEKQWVWAPPKSDDGVRSLSLPVELVELFRTLRVKAMETRLAAGLGRDGFEDSRIFDTNPVCLTIAFTNFCREVESIPEGFTFHGLRHTHITALLKVVGKEGAKAVSKRVGHADVEITLAIYQRVFEEDDRELGDLSSGLFRGRT